MEVIGLMQKEVLEDLRSGAAARTSAGALPSVSHTPVPSTVPLPSSHLNIEQTLHSAILLGLMELSRAVSIQALNHIHRPILLMNLR